MRPERHTDTADDPPNRDHVRGNTRNRGVLAP